MSEEFEEFVDRFREPSVWVRILFMIAFSLAAYFILIPMIIVLSIAQALFTLFAGQSNANLRYFAATLGLYIAQVIEFLTYLSEIKPYPFSDLPEIKGESLGEGSAPSEQRTSPVKKPAAKKKAVKKKAAKKKSAKEVAKTDEKIDEDSSNEGGDNP